MRTIIIETIKGESTFKLKIVGNNNLLENKDILLCFSFTEHKVKYFSKDNGWKEIEFQFYDRFFFDGKEKRTRYYWFMCKRFKRGIVDKELVVYDGNMRR